MASPRTSAAIALHAQSAGSPNQQWVHLLPLGTFRGRDGRGPYSVKDAARVITASRDYAGTAQIPVDYDHQLENAANPTVAGTAPAAGWITGLQVRADGIWGLTEWTATAAAKLADREYRYISPVFTYQLDTGEIGAIISAGLTNKPNLNLKAVAAAGAIMDDQLGPIRTALGLPADASVSDILSAIVGLQATAKASAQPDPSLYVPIAQARELAVAFNRLNQGITQQAAEDVVSMEIERGRLPPAFKGWAIELCAVNKPKFDEFMNGLAPLTKSLFTVSHAVGEPRGAGTVTTSEEAAMFSALGLSPDDQKKYGGSK